MVCSPSTLDSTDGAFVQAPRSSYNGKRTTHAQHWITVGQPEAERAQQLRALGVAAYDALHLACAETGQVDVFLTTDDRLLRRSEALREQLRVRVENPLAWLSEES